jgi:hypothetical protein
LPPELEPRLRTVSLRERAVRGSNRVGSSVGGAMVGAATSVGGVVKGAAGGVGGAMRKALPRGKGTRGADAAAPNEPAGTEDQRTP